MDSTKTQVTRTNVPAEITLTVIDGENGPFTSIHFGYRIDGDPMKHVAELKMQGRCIPVQLAAIKPAVSNGRIGRGLVKGFVSFVIAKSEKADYNGVQFIRESVYDTRMLRLEHPDVAEVVAL